MSPPSVDTAVPPSPGVASSGADAGAADGPSPGRNDALRDLLFRDSDLSVYAVLDGAMIPDLRGRLSAAREESACLYRGELGDDLLATAPYLVKLRADGDIAKWLWNEGWGRSWGIYVVTTTGFEALRRHFRHFLRVRDYAGKVLYFRYYDPRVLRIYLPTCNSGEIATVYGDIARFVCEDEHRGQAIEYPRHRTHITPRLVPLSPRPA
jgi:hypothetical protein